MVKKEGQGKFQRSRQEAGAGGRELSEHGIDLTPVKGEREGRGLGRLVCCEALMNLWSTERRFPASRILYWSEMVCL